MSKYQNISPEDYKWNCTKEVPTIKKVKDTIPCM